MKRRLASPFVLLAACLLAAGVWLVVRTGTEEKGLPDASDVADQGAVAETARPNGTGVAAEATRTELSGNGRQSADGVADALADGGSDAAPDQAEEERRKADEERRVDAFDNLTDTWTVPSKKAVTMADVDRFVSTFRAIPRARRAECVHRALNLVPDENVMLLAGILMDKTMDREIVETVYGDILNRNEEVKKPILQEIFKDKTHPCWTDTAWILDVTGELPKKK